MRDVAELLVLLHGARGRISTVRATVRMWRHVRRHSEALQRAGWASYGPSISGGPESEAIEELVRVWFAPPDRAREEREGSHGTSVGVRRGPHWWRYDEVNGALSNEGAPDSRGGISDELEWLLDAAPVIGLLEFDKIVRARRAGRPVLRVRAVPRTPSAGDDGPLIRLGATGADELLLDVDAERGALLRIESRFEREPIALSEVVEIAFDEAFDEDTFVFTPPAGEAVRSVVDLLPVRHDLTIEQAVALAPFTVWIPARLPADWETQIGFAAEQDRPPMAPQVHLHYRAPDGTHGLSVAESPADHPGEHSDYEHARANPWRTIDRNQRRMQVREPAESWQPAQVQLELDDTRILIHSADLDAAALSDVAAGLVRAPSEPPKLDA
jgi:outer membrane lipoprotein-sorting protein